MIYHIQIEKNGTKSIGAEKNFDEQSPKNNIFTKK